MPSCSPHQLGQVSWLHSFPRHKSSGIDIRLPRACFLLADLSPREAHESVEGLGNRSAGFYAYTTKIITA